MAEVWAAAITAAAAVASTAYTMASAPGAPGTPNLNAASRAGVEAEAATLADRRRLEAAAQQGTSTTYRSGPHTVTERRQFVRVVAGNVPGRSGIGQPLLRDVPFVASEWEPGGKYFKEGQEKPDVFNKNVKVHVPAEMKTADFTGYGEADVQGAVARQNAQHQLDLEKKYSSQFIDESLRQQRLADPEGTAAREKLAELIQTEAARHPDRPVADLLDSQVAQQLAAGNRLDSISDDVLRRAVAESAGARGDQVGDYSQFGEPLTTGFEGQNRLSAAQQKALSWLSSGASPQDAEFRRQQQLMQDEGAFVNGQTPESQFSNLSGAQQGAAPYYTGNRLPGQNPNAGTAAQGAALQTSNIQNNAAANQADPWMAGLSLLLHGASVAGQAGWKPLATSP